MLHQLKYRNRTHRELRKHLQSGFLQKLSQQHLWVNVRMQTVVPPLLPEHGCLSRESFLISERRQWPPGKSAETNDDRVQSWHPVYSAENTMTSWGEGALGGMGQSSEDSPSMCWLVAGIDRSSYCCFRGKTIRIIIKGSRRVFCWFKIPSHVTCMFLTHDVSFSLLWFLLHGN